MASKRAKPKASRTGDSGTADVDAFLARLKHPLKPGLEAVREIILGADRSIGEGIKWNSPSFFVEEWFATVNLRNDAVCVVLHLGAKVKDGSTKGLKIDDPAGLLDWRAKERAVVWFRDLKQIQANRAAFAAIVRQWIAGSA